MIVGNGLIASAFNPHFENDPDVLVFASGVSNSQENLNEAFLRERKMLIEATTSERVLVYFSTCSVNDLQLINTPYVIHKKEMESLVCLAKNYVIFRLPQIVGRTPNQNTLTNYIYRHIYLEKPFKIWRHAKRNFIDVEDVASIVSHLIRVCYVNRAVINIACPFSISIQQLVTIFELVLGKKSNYSLVDAGAEYSIDARLATMTANQIGIDFQDNYIEKVIRKYYFGITELL
jgi:nucleoside-diphosphate-sugar epimerase